MSHTLTENTILSVMNYKAAWDVLADIFRATEGEYAINWGMEISRETSYALDFLFERRLIDAYPTSHAPYHFVASDNARLFFGLDYGQEDREPRNASKATLMGLWD